MYQALYRKWRPQTFDEVVGQKHISETLKNQVKTGRLSHAYLFIGTRGTGKTTCARILAKAVNCENPQNGNPCGRCAACRGITEGTVMDIVELDAASNNGVDNVRALREEAVFSPAAVKKRVYIIDEVHMLSGAAFNALLKILEEPPEHLMFILATTELHKVPATILSRCQRHSFKRIDAPVIASHIEYIASQEHFSIDRAAAALIARLAEGGVRDALSLLDQCSAAEHIDVDAVYSAMGLAGSLRTAALLKLIINHSVEEALEEFNTMWMDGKDPVTVLSELYTLLRDILICKVAPKGGSSLLNGSYDLETLMSFAGAMTREELLCMAETVQRAMSGAKEARNPRTAAELCIISLCDNTAAESISSLRARISRLEEQVKNGIALRPAYDEEPYYEAPRYEPSEEELMEAFGGAAAKMEAEYEDIDPMEFHEEQPEDALLAKAAPDKTSAAPEAEPSPEDAPVNDELWGRVCAKVKASLRFDLRIALDDPAKVRVKTGADCITIEAQPGFVYNGFNRQDVLQRFAEAARELSGKELRVQLAELKNEERPLRSLEELRSHKEVKFIN